MNTNKLTTEQLIVIVILMMGLINGLMSCTSSKMIYLQDTQTQKWTPAPKHSEMTGWTRH